MNKRANNFFWIVYIVFCICSATVLMFFGSPIDPEMGMVNAVILTASLLITGGVLRYWFHKNKDKFKG